MELHVKDGKKLNHHLYTIFYRGCISKVEDSPVFVPEYTCNFCSPDNSVAAQKYADLISHFDFADKNSYISTAYFNALLFELDEFIEYHDVMTKIAKTVITEANFHSSALNNFENSQPSQPLMQGSLNNSGINGKLSRSNSTHNAMQIENIGQQVNPPELKTVVKFQYRQIFEHLNTQNSTRAPVEVWIELIDSQYSLRCTITHLISGEKVSVFRLKCLENDYSRPS